MPHLIFPRWIDFGDPLVPLSQVEASEEAVRGKHWSSVHTIQASTQRAIYLPPSSYFCRPAAISSPSSPVFCLLTISSVCRIDFSLSTPSPPFASNSSIYPAPYVQTLMERTRRASTLLLESGTMACILDETGCVLSSPLPCFQFEK